MWTLFQSGSGGERLWADQNGAEMVPVRVLQEAQGEGSPGPESGLVLDQVSGLLSLFLYNDSAENLILRQ